MDVLRLRDNRFGSNGRLFSRSGENWKAPADPGDGLEEQSFSDKQRKLLEKFKDWDFGTLESLRQRGVVDLSGSHLDTGDRKNLRFLEYHRTGDDSFRLDTGNLMGVLRFRDPESQAAIQVEVLSRFDKDNRNFFLNYLLSRVFDFAQGAEAVSAPQSSILEILLDVIFVRRLGEAAKAGLLRHYREYRNNDWAFKGHLDLVRHIRENIPLPHGIAYVKREIDLDVPVNRMILLAALRVNRRNPSLFESNGDASDALRQLRMGVTEEHDIRAVLAHRDCREPVAHPFFREVWEPLRRIARMILEDEPGCGRNTLRRFLNQPDSGIVSVAKATGCQYSRMDGRDFSRISTAKMSLQGLSLTRNTSVSILTVDVMMSTKFSAICFLPGRSSAVLFSRHAITG